MTSGTEGTVKRKTRRKLPEATMDGRLLSEAERAELMKIPEEKFRFADESRREIKEKAARSKGYFADALARFLKNKGALVAAVILALQLAFALVAPLFSPYGVSFREPYYVKMTPALPFFREREWRFWDGGKKVSGGQARFDFYDGIGAELALTKVGARSNRSAIRRYKKKETDGAASYEMRLDGYYAVGFAYKDLSAEEYAALKTYQNETGIQVIYPLQNNYQSVGANQWYKLEADHQAAATKLHGEKIRYPAATKAQAARDENGNLTPDYKTTFSKTAFGYDSLRLDFSGTEYEDGKPVSLPPVGETGDKQKTYPVKTDENGRLYYWYDDETGYVYRDENYAWQKAETGVALTDALGYYAYAFENQSGYRVRVLYYEYFKFLHGEYPRFYFGTNQYGQDLFACLASGARLSFLLALCVSAINLTFGAAYGAVSGYYGGKTDILLQRIAEFLSAVPFIVVATLFQLHIGNRAGPVVTLLFAFSLTGWLAQAARVRMQFYRFKGREYVLAAKTLGAKDGRIILKHIFPNAIGAIVTGAALAIPAVIFSESTLSYLGVINFETSGFISLGAMLSQGQSLIASAPHVLLFPALFIALLQIAFNLFGNGLRDALNPTLR